MPAATSNAQARPLQSGTQARYVFVYGTLRRDEDNDITRLLPTPRFIGTAAICGRMYHLGPYPGVVLAPVLHRVLHALHVPDDDDEKNSEKKS